MTKVMMNTQAIHRNTAGSEVHAFHHCVFCQVCYKIITRCFNMVNKKQLVQDVDLFNDEFLSLVVWT